MAKENSWLKHLKAVWNGPSGKKAGKSYRETMTLAKKSYKKGAAEPKKKSEKKKRKRSSDL